MSLTHQFAKQFRETYFGGNFSGPDMKSNLSGTSLRHAQARVGDHNTIVALLYHIQYYVRAITRVMEGGALDAKDIYSFDHPAVESEADWERMLETSWEEAEKLAGLIEQFPDERLRDTFVDEKYGNYLRNITGVTEHVHYHLGQIVLIKKLVRATDG